MDPTRLLFTRHQISELVPALDDTTLNYWMRENVLRAAEGGGGRGQHRRFKFSEVNLAAILNEIRLFGAGLASIKELADMFHASEDWARSLGADMLDLRLIHLIQSNQSHFRKHGFFPAPQSEFPDREISFKSSFSGREMVKLNSWTEVRHYMVTTPFYRRELAARFEDRHFDWADKLDAAEVHRHWTTAMHIARMVSEETATSDHPSLVYFSRQPNGPWQLRHSSELTADDVSYIALNIPKLIHRTWSDRL